jgi:Xaa-Pro aminopeptidase
MARDRLREDVLVSDVVKMVCDFFEKYGYPTINRLLNGQSVKLEEGFVHSLGHGVGWSLSDLPLLSLTSRGRLKKGHVFTIEPGLYNPKIGGVRIEDVYTLTGRAVDQISNLDKRLEW